MVERNSRGYFGNFVVFPGGSVDDSDRRGVPDEDGAVRRTAIRELAEEAGILLTTRGPLAAPQAKGEMFYRWLEDSGVETTPESLVLVSRWVTPEIAPRRFDTRFFLAAGGGEPEVRIDTEELVGFRWVTPTEALQRHENGNWAMILPTLAHVRWLQRRETIEDALSSARGADGRSLIQPRLMEDGSLLPIHLPAETV